ncbi:MAG: hypothetical protein KAU22_04510, partial [Desulfuromonadales bacterium]|nr:hypothetical protein [Desulfuromonadales bacterium]
DIEIFQRQLVGWLKLEELPILKRRVLVIADVSCGNIVNGEVQDSDYATDNRTNEWSRSISDADKGFTIDVSGAVGPMLEWSNLKLSVTPLLGYGFNMQDLSMTNGEQTISRSDIRKTYFAPDEDGSLSMPHALGEIYGLDSSYTAYWYGPWLGVMVEYQVSEKVILSVEVEHHWIEYFAEADWNLRSEFEHPVSFEHEANGTGVVLKVSGSYAFNQHWSWSFSGNIQNWVTENGIDRIFMADGTVGKSRLNQVNWESYALTTGVQYRF